MVDVSSVPEDYRAHAQELAEQLDFMRERLEDTRKNLDGAPLVIAYNNGGGQKGVRKNPAFDAYNTLMKTYNATIASLRELVGGEGADIPQRGKLLKFEKKYGKTG